MNNNDECNICYTNEHIITVLKCCNNTICINCLNKIIYTKCPYCRADFLDNYSSLNDFIRLIILIFKILFYMIRMF
jgi:hypothetical protein